MLSREQHACVFLKPVIRRAVRYARRPLPLRDGEESTCPTSFRKYEYVSMRRWFTGLLVALQLRAAAAAERAGASVFFLFFFY